ncbi:hypothetical protein BH10BAC2_BH10BAC2_01540 [soil metagenome]
MLLALFIATHSYAQQTYSVTMNGIGPFKLNMKKAEVEKVLGKEIKLHNLLKEAWNYDTLTYSYNDIPFTFVFDRQSIDDKNYDIILREVKSSSAALKTPSGITIGDDKIKIITTYEAYSIWIIPDYENDYTSRSKTRATIQIQGEETGNVIIFHMYMNKVESISVSWNENYD